MTRDKRRRHDGWGIPRWLRERMLSLRARTAALREERDGDTDPAEGRGAAALAILGMSFVLSVLAVWALYQAAHGGAF